MLYRLRGSLIHTEPSFAVIECAGVGYKCYTTMNTQRSLPAIGKEAVLYTHMNVREDAVDLFGFSSLAELNCFKLLTSVSGVGPKVGLAILSVLSPEQVAVAVAAGDFKTLTMAQGVGNKLAQRVILELKDKLKALGGGEEVTAAAGVVNAAGNAAEAMNALTVLGYTDVYKRQLQRWYPTAHNPSSWQLSKQFLPVVVFAAVRKEGKPFPDGCGFSFE